MQNNKDAGQQDDDKLQLAMTAVEDAGGRLRLSIVLDVSRHQLERYITGAEAMGQARFRQAEIGREDRRRCWYWEKNGNMPAWDRLPLGSCCQQLSAKDAGS
jgi:hypothetical protein